MLWIVWDTVRADHLGRHGSEDESMLTRATYDAPLIELDELLRDLLGSLRETGHLDDTIVILTSDHGEQA